MLNLADILKMLPQRTITKEYIGNFLPKDPIILEAGSHIGRDTVKMAKLWPQSKIYAFEPVLEIYNKLLENTQNYKNIVCYNLALSNSCGKTIMHVSSGRSTALSSLYVPVVGTGLAQAETVFVPQEIETITLNQWVAQNNINCIDFMWLDLQGAELPVLQNSTNILETVKALLVEVNLIERYQGIALYTELIPWLLNQDFEAICSDVPRHGKCNVLFKRKPN